MRPAPKNQLSDKVVAVARIGGVGLTLLFAGFVSMLATIGWIEAPLVTGIVVGALTLAALAWFVGFRPQLMAKRWRYELLDHELYVQHGILTLSRRNIPYARIQNVDTSQGPIDRFFGVSSVTVSTAGGAASIPILDDEVAAQLRDHIDQRARTARQELADAG